MKKHGSWCTTIQLGVMPGVPGPGEPSRSWSGGPMVLGIGLQDHGADVARLILAKPPEKWLGLAIRYGGNIGYPPQPSKHSWKVSIFYRENV